MDTFSLILELLVADRDSPRWYVWLWVIIGFSLLLTVFVMLCL